MLDVFPILISMTTETFNEKYAKLDRLQLIALAGLMLLGAAFVAQRHDGRVRWRWKRPGSRRLGSGR